MDMDGYTVMSQDTSVQSYECPELREGGVSVREHSRNSIYEIFKRYIYERMVREKSRNSSYENSLVSLEGKRSVS